jgi:hypothetical protein
MRFSDIPRNPDSRTLRQFAFIWIIFFGAIGGLQLYKGGTWGWPIIALALGAGVPGLIWPKVLKPIFVTWMILAFPIGWLVSHVILGVVFYALFTPMGLALRLKGHNSLLLKKPDADSFWVRRHQQRDPARYLKQF